MATSINDIPCIYFSAGADHLITGVNGTLCRYLQYTEAELIGKKMESIFTLATRIFQQTHLYPLLQMQGIADEIYITLRTRNGDDVPVLINAERREVDGQVSFHFAGIAVTKRKKFEEEIIAAKKAAEKALNENTTLKAVQAQLQQHAEALDEQIHLVSLQNKELRQFSHLATHSLQEPVRKVLIFTSQLFEAGDAEKWKAAGVKIKKAADEMRDKLAGLQQYVWLTSETPKWETVDLTALVHQVHQQLAAEHSDTNLQLQTEALPEVEGSREQLQFLVLELLRNALRFRKHPEGVHVSISASILQRNTFRQLAGKYRFAPFVQLRITDDGIGFDDQFQEQAFELFRKLHPNSGRGIGLTLCRKIVEMHGGTLGLESRKDAGTTVLLGLPLHQEKVPSAENAYLDTNNTQG